MRSSSIVKVILVALMIIIPKLIYAQIGITAVPFLEINGDARSRGLAGADVAKISRNGLFLNPAALGPVGSIQLTSPFSTENYTPFFSSPWLRGFNVDDLWFSSPKLLIGFDKLIVGYQYNRLNLGQQRLAGELYPRELITFNSFEVNHGLSFAYPISDFVRIGAGVNFIKSDLATGLIIGEDTAKAAIQISLDFGVYGQRPLEFEQLIVTPSFGWSITDFGNGMRYTDNGQKDPLPIIMRGGFGVQVDLKNYLWDYRIISFAGYGALSKLMARNEVTTSMLNGEIITEYKAVGPFGALIKSWDSYQHFNGQEFVEVNVWDQFRRHFGLEATLMELLTFRFGHYYEDENNGNREYDTFGIGIHYKYLSFDYSELRTVENDHPLNDINFYQIGVHIPLEEVTAILNK